MRDDPPSIRARADTETEAEPRRQLPRRVTTPRRPHGALIAAAILIALFIAGEFVTIGVQTAPRAALSRAALRSVLPDSTTSAPALTWTNASPGASGGPINLTGATPLIVAACRGGGSITIELTATTSIDIDCTHPTTAGPIELDTRNFSINVERTAGDPRYVVQLLATTS